MELFTYDVANITKLSSKNTALWIVHTNTGIQCVSRKPRKVQTHHNFAPVSHRVTQFFTKMFRNYLETQKGHSLNAVFKQTLFE